MNTDLQQLDWQLFVCVCVCHLKYESKRNKAL
jgi:hypothetical protein